MSDDKYEEVMNKCKELEKKLSDLQKENENLSACLEIANAHKEFASSTPLPSPLPNVVLEKSSVPYFEARTPASNPLKRNMEVEYWLRQIELITRVKDDATLINAARLHCKGAAELVINSPLFENVVTWQDFKNLVRKKFRGTSTSVDFFRFLNEIILAPHQSPQDLYIEIQGYVYQGLRDYPVAVGNAEELITRIFLQSLPLGLREMVMIKSDAPVDELVDTAAKIWNCRSARKQNSRSQVAVTNDKDEIYCAFHKCKGHSTASCRAKPPGNVCWSCGNPGHQRRSCPFSASQASSTSPSVDAAGLSSGCH